MGLKSALKTIGSHIPILGDLLDAREKKRLEGPEKGSERDLYLRQITRRKAFQLLGIGAGTAIVGTGAVIVSQIEKDVEVVSEATRRIVQNLRETSQDVDKNDGELQKAIRTEINRYIKNMLLEPGNLDHLGLTNFEAIIFSDQTKLTEKDEAEVGPLRGLLPVVRDGIALGLQDPDQLNKDHHLNILNRQIKLRIYPKMVVTMGKKGQGRMRFEFASNALFTGLTDTADLLQQLGENIHIKVHYGYEIEGVEKRHFSASTEIEYSTSEATKTIGSTDYELSIATKTQNLFDVVPRTGSSESEMLENLKETVSDSWLFISNDGEAITPGKKVPQSVTIGPFVAVVGLKPKNLPPDKIDNKIDWQNPESSKHQYPGTVELDIDRNGIIEFESPSKKTTHQLQPDHMIVTTGSDYLKTFGPNLKSTFRIPVIVTTKIRPGLTVNKKHTVALKFDNPGYYSLKEDLTAHKEFIHLKLPPETKK